MKKRNWHRIALSIMFLAVMLVSGTGNQTIAHADDTEEMARETLLARYYVESDLYCFRGQDLLLTTSEVEQILAAGTMREEIIRRSELEVKAKTENGMQDVTSMVNVDSSSIVAEENLNPGYEVLITPGDDEATRGDTHYDAEDRLVIRVKVRGETTTPEPTPKPGKPGGPETPGGPEIPGEPETPGGPAVPEVPAPEVSQAVPTLSSDTGGQRSATSKPQFVSVVENNDSAAADTEAVSDTQAAAKEQSQIAASNGGKTRSTPVKREKTSEETMSETATEGVTTVNTVESFSENLYRFTFATGGAIAVLASVSMVKDIKVIIWYKNKKKLRINKK